MADSPDIHRELADGVLRITIDRPDAGNAITADQRETIIAWLDDADTDPEVRCIVLGATGRFFCTGADLRQPPGDPRPEPATGDIRRTMLRGTIRLMHALLDSEKPIIARVQGTAAGIGAHLAFCCDLVVVSEDAKFIEIFARRGLAYAQHGPELLEHVALRFSEGVSQDIEIWENKIFRSRPVLVKGEAGIMANRKWAAQFYSAEVELPDEI